MVIKGQLSLLITHLFVPVAYSLFEGAKGRLGLIKTKPGVIDPAGHAILDNPDA